MAEGPVDSVRTPSSAERSSQVRARDRATLRTIKELAEKEGHLAQGGAPTRRQLRLLQLAAETAPATSANLIVPVSPRTRATPVVAQPASRAAQPPRRRAPAPAATAPRPPAGPGRPLGRTTADRRARGPGGPPPEGMTVEQALAARELLARQAHNQMTKMEHIAATDPDAVDPDVLAEQIALAERAAVLNRRAAAKQKLAEQNSQPRSGPQRPVDRQQPGHGHTPGIRRGPWRGAAGHEAPCHVPCSGRYQPGPRVENPRKSGTRRPGFSLQRGPGPATGRAGVLARAEAAARASGGSAPGGSPGDRLSAGVGGAACGPGTGGREFSLWA